jgi:hypothetical protein
LPRKSRHEEDDDMKDEDEMEDKAVEDDDEDDDDDDDDAIGLDEAEEEEEDDDDVDDDDEEEDGITGKSAEDIEKKRLFQAEAEDILENLTLEDVKEVLKDNEMDEALAPRLKKLLTKVVSEGEMTSMDDAWDEAMERLEE